MKTNSFSSDNRRKCKRNIILDTLVSKSLNKIAREREFIKRKGGKISPKNLLLGFLMMVSKQRNTYSDWASEVGFLERKSVTKQAIHERMKPETESFIKEVVEKVIAQKMPSLEKKKIRGLLSNFKSVKIDDSTYLRLPDELAKEFPGTVREGKQLAQAKIHAMYNLTENNFSFLHIHSFTNNDQSLSPVVLPFLQKGDLCLRDLGFTVLNVTRQFIERGIYFISRKNYLSKVFDATTGFEIDLLEQLRKTKFFDAEVLIGKEQKLKVRMIAIPVPEAQANERKRKARKDRDRRLNHKKEYYELLGYSIYLTNISPKKCTTENILQLITIRKSE